MSEAVRKVFRAAAVMERASLAGVAPLMLDAVPCKQGNAHKAWRISLGAVAEGLGVVAEGMPSVLVGARKNTP
jgi:hypothetical protein